jgi:hypothetical protein
VCVEGEVKNSDKRIITKEWIRLCCDSNMKLDASNVSEVDCVHKLFFFNVCS